MYGFHPRSYRSVRHAEPAALYLSELSSFDHLEGSYHPGSDLGTGSGLSLVVLTKRLSARGSVSAEVFSVPKPPRKEELFMPIAKSGEYPQVTV